MQVILWEFRVRPEAVGRFLEQYGPSGSWAALFKRGEGYLGTELLGDPADPARFVTIDRWQSREARERFLGHFGEAYAALDHACEALTLSERLLGEFEAFA